MCSVHSAARKQHPCLSNTRRWFHQFLVIYRWLDKEGGGGHANVLIFAFDFHLLLRFAILPCFVVSCFFVFILPSRMFLLGELTCA